MTTSSFEPHVDHIFGDMDKPENAVTWLRNRNRGVHHYHHKSPVNPKPLESVRLFVTTSVDRPVESVQLWVTTDDWTNRTLYNFSHRKTIWRTELWSYIHEWEIILPPQPAGTMLRYKIGAQIQGSETMIYAESQLDDFQTATNFSIWYSDGQIPDWAHEAIIYQIFVDRFDPGFEKVWRQSSDLRKTFGGTLHGVIDKLSYIKNLGFNCLWLTPIFASPTHHGYDISDYDQINHNFGSMDDFVDLLQAAHAMGMRVILDFVANHCSTENPFFQDALENPKSQYHDYFVWTKWPDYECFYNVRSMPKLNLAFDSPARDYLLQCAQNWLKLGVDGFRLDYAHGPEQDFWVDFRRACEAVKPDYWTFGEIVQPADVQITFAGGLLGTLDFLLCQALRLTFGQREWPLSKFASFLQDHIEFFPEDFTLPSFIDNHDMNRFIVAANNDEQLLRMALMVLYVLPGPPIIYYGTEIALSQNQSIHAKGAQGFDEARLPMPWDKLSTTTLPALLAKLAEIRKTHPQIWQTGWHVCDVNDENETLIMEKLPNQDYLLLINRSGFERTLKIPIKKASIYRDLYINTIYECDHNILIVRLSPLSGMILTTSQV